MSNTRQIQPIEVWTSQGLKTASILALTNFYDYHFDNGNGKVTYKLIGMEGDPASAIEYITESLEIPASIIQQWGESDDIIFSYVANKLNLIIVP
jgi:hypothetical protein